MTDIKKDKACIFCKIIQGTLPCEKVFENDKVFAFRDNCPQAPVHVLIVPKTHVVDVLDVTPDKLNIFSHLFEAVQLIAPQLKLSGPGFRTVFNSGDHACQTMYHLHLHLLGGTQMGGSLVG